MATKETYFADVIGLGHAVDVMPYVYEAMERCSLRYDFSAREVAELVEAEARGKYIPVDVLNRIEDRAIGQLIGVAISWVRSEYRIAQISGPDLQKHRPYIELDHFEGTSICDEAKDMCGRWLKVSELARFPLPNCRHDLCTCSYRTRSRREGPRVHPDWPEP